MIPEIAPDVFCLGPHGRTQTNIYFVRSGASWTLIDTGWAGDEPRILEAVAKLFGPESRPAAILLTHDHPDHGGAAKALAQRWEGPVWMHPAELPIAMGDFSAMERFAGPLDRWLILPIMRAIGRTRREAAIARSSLAEAARALDPSAAVPGLPDWECVPTPGHTPGHISLFRRSDRVLISGDALVTLRVNSPSGFLLGSGGLSAPPRYTSWDWNCARASIDALARLEPNTIGGGHGKPLAGPDTAAALSTFAERLPGRPKAALR
jgi:glyoxylase-like metal-dependent hydrolase (beta-lactamase superfamily II)